MNAQAQNLAQALWRALQANELDTAESLAQRLEALAPGEVNTLQLVGALDLRRGRAARARERLARACALAPKVASLWVQRGNAEQALGDAVAAASSFRHAIDLAPQAAHAHYNLGVALQQARDWDGAARAFVRAGRLQPDDAEACQRVVDCAAQLARAGDAPPPSPAPPGADPDACISVICCSITQAKLAALRANLDQALHGGAWELIHIDDARSLAEGYTRALSQARGEVALLVHDDIEVWCEDFRARLLDALRGADVVGVLGSTRMTGPAVSWSGLPLVHGWVTHLHGERQFAPGLFSLAPPRVDGAQCLDGLFLAARTETARRIGFDAETFDGFHFYDLDFSYRAFQAGLRLRIQSDLRVRHREIAPFPAGYWDQAPRFCTRFPQACTRPEHAPGSLFTAVLDERASVQAFYGWLEAWLG